MTPTPEIFKKYDIRGRASGGNPPMNPDAARAIGQAFASYLRRALPDGPHRVYVGRDNRETSPTLQAAVIDGLRGGGCDVTDLGLVATPVVYWHTMQVPDSGGVMVTGSHLAADQNGLKLNIGNRSVYGEAIQMLRRSIEANDLEIGSGTLQVDQSAVDAYVADLTQRIEMARPLRVVVDAGNGVGGLFGPRLIEAWGHQVVGKLFIEPDARFPNHHPNPQVPENMRDLGQKVREVGADVGIAFDGDADRMGAVDENGELIAADRLLALLAVDMLARHPGQTLVGDVLCSQVLFDAVREAGGQALMAASGHALVKDAMRQHGAMIGGEMSGHIFLGEHYFGYDDGFFAAGRLLQLLAGSGRSLSQLDADLPTLTSTPEYRPACPDADKALVIAGVAEQLSSEGEVETVDGFRLSLPQGWGILRASNTEPVLSLRFEGQTQADAMAIKARFVAALRAFPQVDLAALLAD